MKHVEEAVAIRDTLLTAFDRASVLPPGPERQRLLTVTFVGGGFSGVEGFGELLSLATSLLRTYPELSPVDLSFHLVEAAGRILPEVTDEPGRWVVRALEERGAHVHLDTQLVSAVGGHVVLSTGQEFDSELIVWAAGNAANPVVAQHTDLPVDDRGFLRVRADLRVGTAQAAVPDAWAAGDDAAVPDLAVGTPGARTAPNAQHAVRQGRHLAANIAAVLRGGTPRDYVHRSLGVVATLGLGQGVFQYRRLVVTGFPAWVMHRGYHMLAVPTWERKIRVLTVWLAAAVFGRESYRSPASSTRGTRSCVAGRRGRRVLPGWVGDHTCARTRRPTMAQSAVRRGRGDPLRGSAHRRARDVAARRRGRDRRPDRAGPRPPRPRPPLPQPRAVRRDRVPLVHRRGA